MTAEQQETLRESIRQLSSAVSSLEEAFPGRKFPLDGHLVGSIGEVVAAYVFDLHLFEMGRTRHDAVTRGGKLVQVKLTCVDGSIEIKYEPQHLIVLQLTDNGFNVVYNGEGNAVWQQCNKPSISGERSITLKKLRALEANAKDRLPGVRDFPAVRFTRKKAATAGPNSS